MSEKKCLISVCLCTYQRRYVFSTLKSLAELRLPKSVEIEIIVINNAPQDDLENRILEFAEDHGLAVKFDVEPEQNISLARNRSVELAVGDWIAFIDDDETADPDWLSALYHAAIVHEADAIMGVVIAEYSKSAPQWIIKSRVFNKPLPQTGTILNAGRTSNALLRSSWVMIQGHRFDPSYGLTGGGDSLFFQQIQNAGGKMISCREAIVYEFNDEKRLNMGYLFRRAVRRGECYARIHYNDLPILTKMVTIALNVAKMIAFAGYACLCLPFGRHLAAPPLLRSISQIGKLRHELKARAIKIYKV